MPDHVHAIPWVPETGCPVPFIETGKSRARRATEKFAGAQMREYAKSIEPATEEFGEAAHQSNWCFLVVMMEFSLIIVYADWPGM